MAYDETERVPLSEAETTNATKFHLQDVPFAQRRSEYDVGEDVPAKWLRFHGYNTGVWNGFWADNDRRREQDNQAILNAIGGQLGLSHYQQERARYLLCGVNYPTYSPFYTVRDICLIVCLLVVNADYDGEGMVYYPTRKYPKTGDDEEPQKGPSEKRVVLQKPHETFERLVDSLGVDERVLEKGIPKFRYLLNRDKPGFSPPI